MQHEFRDPHRGLNSVHHACFRCRKSFKQPGSSHWDPAVPVRPFSCPDCKRPMVRMGKYFKAPARRALKQWLKVELLHSYGERFEASETPVGVNCVDLRSAMEFLVRSGHPVGDVRGRVARLRALQLADEGPA